VRAAVRGAGSARDLRPARQCRLVSANPGIRSKSSSKPLSPTMSRDHSECFALYLQISSSSSDRRTPRRAASPPRQPSSGTRNRFRIYCATLPLWGSSDTQRYCPDYAARIAGFGARRRRAIGPAVGIPSAKCTFCPRGGTAAAASRTARVREGRHRGQTAGSGSRARVRLARVGAGGRGWRQTPRSAPSCRRSGSSCLPRVPTAI